LDDLGVARGSETRSWGPISRLLSAVLAPDDLIAIFAVATTFVATPRARSGGRPAHGSAKAISVLVIGTDFQDILNRVAQGSADSFERDRF